MTFFFKKKGLTKKLTFLFLFIFFIAFLFFREGDVYAWVCHDPGRSACQEPPDPTNPVCPSGWEMVPGCNSEGCTLSNMSHDLFKYWCNNSGQGGAQPGTVPVVPQSSNNQQQQLPETPVVVPTQEVPIPGLTFTNKIEFCSSNPDLTDMSQCPSGDRVFVIPWLGQYIIAIYKWALRAIIILAIFMIMLGGVQWIVSRGSPTGIASAKSKIGASIVAVVIILCVNLILSLINPQLTILKPITIGRIATINLEIEELNMNSSIIGGHNCPDLTPDKTKSCKPLEIVATAESFLGQNSGPCHCACFVSRVLRVANCGLDGTYDSWQGLESWLVAHNWTKKDGKDGVSTGDVVAMDGHIGLAISSSKIIDSGPIHEGKTENGCTQKAATCPNVWHGLNNSDGKRYWEGGSCESNQTIKERGNFFTRYWINPNH